MSLTKGWLLLSLLLCGYQLSQAQGESLNFCDIPCVNNIYKFYCGEAKCTTGASDYGQIFQLCTAGCVAAVAGEAMGQCLTTTVPGRADWPGVQLSVVREIVEFCAGYQIEVDASVTPLSLKDTDKKLLDGLYEDPEGEKEKKKKKQKKEDKTKKEKSKKGKKTEDRDEKKEKKASKERPKKLPKERSEKPVRKTAVKKTKKGGTKDDSKKPKEEPSIAGDTKDDSKKPKEEPSAKGTKDNSKETKETKERDSIIAETKDGSEKPEEDNSITDETSVDEVDEIGEEESNDETASPDLDVEAAGSTVAEEAGSEIEEDLERFESPK